MTAIDINCDLGEGFGPWRMGDDAGLLAVVTSANIACGFHAGDPIVMAETVALAVDRGVALGAHPGLPDLAGFGRREMALSPREVHGIVLYQIGALSGFAAARRSPLRHVKPHGALYWMAERGDEVATAIAYAVRAFDPSLRLIGLSGGRLVRAGEAAGLTVGHEIFADRAYRPDGSLLSRAEAGSVLTDAEVVSERMVRLLTTGVLAAADGTDLRLRADTICVHGDTAGARNIAIALAAALTAEGISLCPLGEA